MASTPEKKATYVYEAPAEQDKPPHHGMSVGEYLRTRFSSLKPPMLVTPNPLRLLLMLDRVQWAFFLVAFGAWTWDAFDFFTVSLTIKELAKEFGKTNTQITWGITLVLMFRSLGSVIFGIAADRYGQKWPFVVNNFLFIVLELSTGFCQTYKQFLACRALFGIAMGGLFGNAASTALEDVPDAARAFARGLVGTTSHGWRPLFWFGSGPPVLFIIFRLMLPETKAYRRRQAILRVVESEAGETITSIFLHEGKIVLRRHWKVLTYLVLLMASFNFMSHGSQDLYPTMLQNQYNFSKNKVTLTQIIANLGAIAGGTSIGFCSQIFGRRFTIIVMCMIGSALLYPYTRVSTDAIMAVAFFQQFCVQGAWSVIPIHLLELSPSAFRTFVVGTSYQLGSMASSASSTIESSIGERLPLPPKGNAARYDYGSVICIFLGCVYGILILLTFFGPEHMHRRFDTDADWDAAELQRRKTLAKARHSGPRGASCEDDVEAVITDKIVAGERD